MASLGFDWLFIDSEHAPLSPESIQSIIRAAGDTPCLVRVSSNNSWEIQGALDSGAAGIIVPQVNSAAEAQKVLANSKYSPEGKRGVGVSRAHGYGQNFKGYLDGANDSTVVVVQAEHTDAVKNIDEIAQVPEIDAILVGPYDLSASMGIPGQIDHPDLKKAIGTIKDSCDKHNMPIGYFGISASIIQSYMDIGFTLIIAGADMLHLAKSARAILEELR